MNEVFLRFFDICRFKAGPQDLPTSKFLLAVVLAAYGVFALLLSLGEKDLGVAMQMAIADTLLLVGLSYIVLWTRDVTERYVQMLTAIAGCAALLELVIWPLLLLQQYGANDGGTFFIVIATLLLWAWLIWEVAIFAYIFKHALDTSIWMGVIISLFYIFLSYRMMRTLFFVPQTTEVVPVT